MNTAINSSSPSGILPMPGGIACAGPLREREERLESLKLLAGHLAHDFNNFLVPILGYVSLIKEDLAPDAPGRQYATAIETAARRTEGLLDAVLLATRPQRRFRPVLTDLRELVEREMNAWMATLPANARITLKADLAGCSTVLDPAQWRNVIQQLLFNVHFALATGGTVTVTLQPRTLPADRAVELGMAASTVFELMIHDDGFGMSPAVQQRAFEPFFSTRPKTQGAGLGLTIVHSVVRLHGGQVLLDSQEDAGTTVRIWSPITQTEPVSRTGEVGSAQVRRAAPRPLTSSKVLLVDDDPLVLEVIKTCLQRAQFEVHVAMDGQEGLKLYRRHARNWALVITDLAMPVMNGIDMVLQIRQLEPDLEVILVSGDVEASSQENLARLGQPQPTLIRKPFTLKGLMEAIRTHVGRHSSGSLSRKPCN
ncbi:MAG: response regulator [Verrucomicrobia bacterium]|nr:response regulator [Verrucomicrobiota bacterium]